MQVADMKPEVAAAQGKKFGIEAMPVDKLLARNDIQVCARYFESIACCSASRL